ncbi:hypothetical protein CPI06_06350, partial [Moraxella catarrhalis]|nr:hypothetical protein [Moraxella catarrhalis]
LQAVGLNGTHPAHHRQKWLSQGLACDQIGSWFGYHVMTWYNNGLFNHWCCVLVFMLVFLFCFFWLMDFLGYIE